jgi:membrane glycosyltransferase
MAPDEGKQITADEPVPSVEEDGAAGDQHHQQDQTEHAPNEPININPQQSQLQPDLSEDDAMAEAMKESLMQHEKEEGEKHQYDAYQLQDQEYEPDLVCRAVNQAFHHSTANS